MLGLHVPITLHETEQKITSFRSNRTSAPIGFAQGVAIILQAYDCTVRSVGQVKLLFETVISAFWVVNTLLLCVGCVLLFFGNVG